MQKVLNKESFYVNDDEFPIFNKEPYSTLQLYPQLGIFEREIGLISDIISNLGNMPTFINIGLSHGGFLPIKMLPFVDNITVITTNEQQLSNINKNCELYDKNNKIKITNDAKSINIDNSHLKIIKFDLLDNNSQYLCDILRDKNDNTIILSYDEIQIGSYKIYKLNNSNLILYLSNDLVGAFEIEFDYCLNSNILDYDNLINLCMIVKNAGSEFKNILEKNLPYIDQWTFLDTGSTDDTVETIKNVLKVKKGKLYEEPFINFRDSRNRCLELAGKSCKFNIMIDDTYVINGNVREFLGFIRSDQFADSYNIFINSNGNIYGSDRVLKSDKNLKYVDDIHEIIQQHDNVVVQLPLDQLWIDDVQSDYMKKRTRDRKQYDLKLLEGMIKKNPERPRTYYYITQTYCELQMWDKAFEYAQKRIAHAQKGYEEEITECYLICGNIAEHEFKWDWNKCEQIYLNCYDHDKTKADPLYCIGTHYMDINDRDTAYNYLKKAFELGVSRTATSNLRMDIYNKLLPCILSPLCYQMEDYELGQLATERYSNNNPPDQTNTSFSNIFKILNQNNQNVSAKLNKKDKPNKKDILCFVADGGFNNWSGKSINNIGVGGSETYIIEMSKNIAKLTNYDVYVFCKTDTNEVFENVKYRSLNDYIKFINSHKVHTCIISRYSEYIPITVKNDVDNVYFVVHDLSASGNVIPFDNKLKGIFCMSEWHKNYFLNTFPMMKDITHVFPNGININNYPKNIVKKKNSFIYSSFANRGLLNLLKMFPQIRQKLPNATLNVFCDTKNVWVRSVSNDEMDLVEKLLDEQKEYVINHGWVTKDILTKHFLQSDFWLYPCTFQETFCVTALEAAGSQTLAITNNLAALVHTVSDRGIMINGDANDIEWQNEAIDELMKIINDENKKNDILNKNRKWAEAHDWEELAKIFIDTYIGKGKEIINKEIDNNHFEKYYGPIEENIRYLCDRFSHCKKVLEIGPGIHPFPLATHFIDHVHNDQIQNLLVIDITKNKLPFVDDEFDLIYCRHVMEDIENVEFVINELFRIAKNVYIETPSPLAETTRHIDGPSPYYRGYVHHRNLIWTYENTLKILPKYPVIEYIDIPDNLDKLKNPYDWNTYYVWNKSNGYPTIKMLKYDIDYDLHTEYEKMIKQSIKECKQSLKIYKNYIASINSSIEYKGMLNWSSDVPIGSKQIFKSILDKLQNINCKILEIGTYTGTSIINMLKYLPNAKATVIDMWEDYEENDLLQSMKKNRIEDVFLNNIKISNVMDRITIIKGDSKDALINLLLTNNKYDFIYVDGSHKCLDCYSDMIFSWELLKSGGILGIDDYLWKPENNNYGDIDKLDMPYYAVEHFMNRYKEKYTLLNVGYRVFLQKN